MELMYCKLLPVYFWTQVNCFCCIMYNLLDATFFQNNVRLLICLFWVNYNMCCVLLGLDAHHVLICQKFRSTITSDQSTSQRVGSCSFEVLLTD